MILLINKVLEFCLRVAGLGPFRCNIVGLLIVLSIIITSLPFQCWKLIDFTKHPDVFIENLGYISTQVLIFIKLFYMWKNKRCINHMLLQIYDEWRIKTLPDEWVNLAWYSRIFCSVDVIANLIGILFYYVDILTMYTLEKQLIQERKLALAAKYPFNFQRSPVYEMVLLMHYCQTSFLALVDSLSKSLLVVFVFHVTVNIDKLKSYVQDYSDSLCSSRSSHVHDNRYLKKVVTQHLKILTLVRDIDGTYSEMIFYQLLLSNLLICMTAFAMITTLKITNFIPIIKLTLFIIILFSQCFTFCFVGQYLHNKGELITDMIYNIIWFDSDSKDVRTIALILANTQKPLELSGKIFVLSMTSFTAIVKTSMTYLSVLRAMYS